MIIYFADRKMNILGRASTNLPKGARITDDLKTEEVEAGVKVFECDISHTTGDQEKIKEWAGAGNYILRKSGEETEFYTIIDSENDSKNRVISIYAEDAGLDLLNEVVEPYEADQAYPITHYIERFSYDSGFEVGINEVSNLSRKLKWEGEETATARILSVATQFDAEVKYRFEVKGLAITHKYIDVYKKIGMDTGIKLRLNRDIDRIVTKESVANLATALNVKGGTPEGQENPITLNGYHYDDGDFYVDGTMLKSRKALEKWSRYLWETGPDAGHIVQQYSYDTTSQSELCNRAVSRLKKICDMEVNYEVDISKLPPNAKIGDTVYIVDGKDQTYLSARILKLETSVSQKTNKATLGDYLIQSRGISQKLEEMAQQFQNIAANRIMYTWIVYADDEQGTGISLYPDGKIYMGIAANQLTNIVNLSDPSIFEWSLIKGDKGETGEQGPQGEQGNTGEKGDKGDKGDQGDKGETGDQGPKGEAGPAGPKGDKGDTGAAGPKGDKGDKGPQGPKGDTGIIVSATAPASPVTGQLWQSAAGQPIKRWDGSKWVIHYLSVENLKVQSLSALSANLGTVTAGKIQNSNSSGYVVIDLNTGEIKSYNDTDLAELSVKAGRFLMTGKDTDTNQVMLGISPEDGFSGTVSGKRVSIQPGPAYIDGKYTSDFELTPEGKSGIMMYQRLSNVPEKVYRASLVVNPGGNNYVRIFTVAQLQQIFGTPFDITKLTGTAINGDAANNSNRLAELQYWSNDGLYLYFWSTFNAPFRANIKLEYG